MSFQSQRPKREVVFDRSDRGGRKPQAPKKPAGWSHQNDLAALRGKKILFCVGDGAATDGILLEADQFTIKVQVEGISKPQVIFKSALASFGEA